MRTSKYLIEGPIPAAFVSKELSGHHSKTSAGAHACFLGQVRDDQVDGKRVTGIEYSAYGAMVDTVVQAIKDQLFKEFSDLICLHIYHSTGLVQSGEISLVVMVSSGHRKQSFAALEKCVELIKEKLPIWKKEFFSDGTSRWIQ
ncbi:MAG: molybdenum cofactor biosynthesis protein MoaE [Porphyromonadaceae bacterium]|nr:MAG: molybdenum cofactor biosynthesis protein MoaE [Porphyromonadaceae bacterium]